MFALVLLVFSLSTPCYAPIAPSKSCPKWLGDIAGVSEREPWEHVELGAANYGTDTIRKIELLLLEDLRKTYPYTIQDSDFFRNELREMLELYERRAPGELPNEDMLATLKQTLIKLVEKNGPKGIVYLNDLKEESAREAVQQMEVFARRQGWTDLKIKPLPGDYTDPSFGFQSKPDSLYLIHPCRDLLTEKSPEEVEQYLTRLARGSKNGIVLVTYYLKEFMAATKGSKLKIEYIGEGTQYRFPGGKLSTKGMKDLTGDGENQGEMAFRITVAE